MEVRGDVLTDKENAGAALLDACKEVKTSDPVQIGNYRGFDMSVAFDAWRQEYTLLLKGQMTHRTALGTDPRAISPVLTMRSLRCPASGVYEANWMISTSSSRRQRRNGKPFPYETICG